MSTRRSITGLFFILLLLGFVRLPAASAQQGRRAGLIIQQPGVEPRTSCVAFSEETISGFELLIRSGLEIIAEQGPMGAAVCSISGQGCPASDCLTCNTTYWSYWHLVNGSWVYGARGASSYQVGDGAVEGWVWGDGKSPPPVKSFGEICEVAAPTATPSATPTSTNTPSATPTETATATTAQLAAAASSTATPTASLVPGITPSPTAIPATATAVTAVQASVTPLPSSTPMAASPSPQADASIATLAPAAVVGPTLGAAEASVTPDLSTPTLGINQPRRTPVTSTPRPTITPSSTPAPLPSLAAAPPPKATSGRPPLFGYAVFGVLIAGLGAAALLLRLRR